MDLLAEVVREAPVPLWLIDSQGLVALANLEAIRFLGYRKENDVVGGPSHELLHRSRPDGTPYPEHECPIVGSAGSAPATECFVTRAGDARPVRWSTRSISDGHATLLSFSPEPRAEAQIVRELRSRGPGPRTSPAQARAELRESLCRTISSRFTDPQFTTAELAASAHLSVRSVQALFAEAGTSPAAEIRRVRLEHARALLGRGHAVQTACLASGFLDPGTFARAFRQRFGCAPSQVPASLAPV
ncbi:helix-turn-helix domain-containing protein [Arthrobacter koreensis]|uniref:Helix-turn-helix domain-containing protein n=1 Tax=Arthrobacter koreensis TaxID=199136 RepID=A0ABY6FRZ1_9MICC|nr:helix-turn-helix domain-containing protein [Arthrobacter koreensis]MEB7447300.1 helix-turn-helix domain-containing protein [Arthrobacter koreensis]UYB35952.1 helix-turn-helix domain-containing protein [Arthrobacter koreensis]